MIPQPTLTSQAYMTAIDHHWAPQDGIKNHGGLSLKSREAISSSGLLSCRPSCILVLTVYKRGGDSGRKRCRQKARITQQGAVKTNRGAPFALFYAKSKIQEGRLEELPKRTAPQNVAVRRAKQWHWYFCFCPPTPQTHYPPPPTPNPQRFEGWRATGPERAPAAAMLVEVWCPPSGTR